MSEKSWRRFAAPAALAFLAVQLLLAGVAELWVGSKAENVSDLVRPELTDEGLVQHRHDFETARNGLEGLREEVLPAVARSLEVQPAALESEIHDAYPAVGRLFDQQSALVPFAEQSLVNLERQQDDFGDADSLPFGDLPAYSGGIVNIALALALFITFELLLRAGRAGARRHTLLPATVTAIALLLIVTPLAFRFPQKSASAQSVLDSLNPSTAVVERTDSSIATTDAGVGQLRREVLPDLAAALGMSDEAFLAAISQTSPRTAAALDELPEILERYEARLAIREGGAGDLRTLKDIPFTALGWFDPAFGAVLALVAAWLFQGRSPADAERS